MAKERTRKEFEQLAQRHLWMYFSELSSRKPSPVITRGEGCYVIDDEGKRYIDGLSGLFLSQVGHGRVELAEAAYEQATRLHFFSLWTYTHPMAIELAAKLVTKFESVKVRSKEV